MKSLGIDKLSVEERIELVEEIWDSIATDDDAFPLTDAQRAELEHRYHDNEAHPEDVTSWEAVKAAAIARMQR